MDINLIRSEDVTDEEYSNIITLLKSFKGPLNFIPDNKYVRFEKSEITDEWLDKVKDREQDVILFEKAMSTINPSWHRVVSWDKLFEKCNIFRRRKNIATDAAVMLFTGIDNKGNWFSAADPEGGWNFFIQTRKWDHYISEDYRYPVAYEIVVWILRKMMFSGYHDLQDHIHMKPIGCMNDFCQNKADITFKLRTGDICPQCQEKIRAANIPANILMQIFDIMESVRSQMIYRERFHIHKQPSAMRITGRKRIITFNAFNNAELQLTPLEKIVYMLYLEYPEGIAFNELDQYRETLKSLYLDIAQNHTLANLNKSLDDLTNPVENSLSEKVSKIRRKITRLVGDEMAEFYTIEGARNGRRRIALDRSLVEYVN